jgi:EAL domain-containing protein (putative c-di-GMP-specific phosphodiesterase class I)
MLDMGGTRTASGARARADLLNAIEGDEVAPLFQPIVDLRTGLVSGYEALSRFMRGTRDVARWFEEAHELGMGARLEAHAIARALSSARRPYGSFLALNVSPAALLSPEVREVLPHRLDGIVLELTGHGPSPPDDGLREACQDIRERGGRIAVDLAGSDYAGLREVMMTAPDILKLDRSLVHRVHLDPAKAAMVGALVGYARQLEDITVCGEGVEQLEDLQRLAELDVTYAQGYVVGRPARPWASVDTEASHLCQETTAAAVTTQSRPDELGGDGRLQWLTLRLSEATDFAELDEAIIAIEGELGAEEVTVSGIDGEELVLIGRSGVDLAANRFRIADFPATQQLLTDQAAVQVLVNDPEADPAEVALLRELEFTSVLMLPLMCAGLPIGLFEAYRRDGRPFGRYQIGRARIIALQLGATLERLSRR